MFRESRPFGITILSAYYILWGLASAMWSLLTSVFGVVLVCFAPGLLASGIWGLIQGVLSIVLGFSLYSGKDWARAGDGLGAGRRDLERAEPHKRLEHRRCVQHRRERLRAAVRQL